MTHPATVVSRMDKGPDRDYRYKNIIGYVLSLDGSMDLLYLYVVDSDELLDKRGSIIVNPKNHLRNLKLGDKLWVEFEERSYGKFYNTKSVLWAVKRN